MRNAIIFMLFISIVLLNGCALRKPQVPEKMQNPTVKKTNSVTSQAKRIHDLQQLMQWSIKGKIAFISEDKRQSFSFRWTVNENNNSQHLDLTTYLGINILKLESQLGVHTVTVDGKKSQGTDLEKLIYSSTGLIIPTKAMHGWLKGIVQNPSDLIEYAPNSLLPSRLITHYAQSIWHIDYDNYLQVGDVQLAKKFTIKQNGLVMKILINRWRVL